MHKTYNGLSKWNKMLFKKMGYLLMYSENIKEYEYYNYCIDKFQKCIDEKISLVRNSDVKNDLQILKDQNTKLKRFITSNLEKYLNDKNIPQYSTYKTGNIGRTSCELERWLDELFQKLGWMVLAIDENNKSKLNNYVSSIQRIKNLICEKIIIVNNHDSKNNLQLLYENVQVLENFVNKIINPKLENMNQSNEKNKRTLCQIHGWYVSLFKKTGWMLLVIAENNKLKLDNFSNSINDFIIVNNNKQTEIQDQDTKNDLIILNDNMKILKDYVTNNLVTLMSKNDNKMIKCHQHTRNILRTKRKLYKWTVRTFKKMGWMILALKENDQTILKHYVRSINKLSDAIKLKIDLLHCVDSKYDMHIIKNYVDILKSFIETNKFIQA